MLAHQFLHSVSVPAKQRGAVLVLSLIVLAILTILGVAAMNTTSLELKMSNNALEKTVVFQRAEDVRGQAQAKADAIYTAMESGSSFNSAASGAGMTKGYYDVRQVGTNAPPTPPSVTTYGFWANANNYQPVGSDGSGYVIEYLGVFALYAGRNDNTELRAHVFRLTVAGRGDDGAQSVVQAMYVRS